jgi:tight adherence protein C
MTTELLLTLLAVFATVAVISGALASLVLTRTAPGRRRLRQPSGNPGESVLLDTPTSLSTQTTDIVQRLTTLVPRSPKDMTRLRKRFVRAGYQTMTPIAVFTLAQMVCPVIFGIVPLFFPPFPGRWLTIAVMALMGLQIPSFVLGRITKNRQKAITNGLPDVLDLLIVCLEAGSSLDQAILRASEELAIVWPALAAELKILLAETRAGKPRLEAFRNLADRTGVDDVRALVAMLVQTDRFGTSIAQALRTHAETSRTKRRQRAEERAAKIGVKLVFPLVFLLFPAFFVVTLGPAVIQFINVFFGQIMGGG